MEDPLFIRQNYYYDDDWSFWYTREGYILKWSLFFALCAVLLTWVTVGRWHAAKRVRAGQKPVFSTGWLVPRSLRAPAPYAAWPGYPHPAPGYYNGRGGAYGMHDMPPPPPVYDANRPPMYEGVAPAAPPEGSTKVDPQQGGAAGGIVQGAPQYPPPAGPPPAR